jgi:hypothetical protein
MIVSLNDQLQLTLQVVGAFTAAPFSAEAFGQLTCSITIEHLPSGERVSTFVWPASLDDATTTLLRQAWRDCADRASCEVAVQPGFWE